jgi:hypothetical protein
LQACKGGGGVEVVCTHSGRSGAVLKSQFGGSTTQLCNCIKGCHRGVVREAFWLRGTSIGGHHEQTETARGAQLIVAVSALFLPCACMRDAPSARTPLYEVHVTDATPDGDGQGSPWTTTNKSCPHDLLNNRAVSKPHPSPRHTYRPPPRCHNRGGPPHSAGMARDLLHGLLAASKSGRWVLMPPAPPCQG